MESYRLNPDERGRIIQTAIQKISERQGKDQSGIAAWLKSWSESHSEEFKSSVAPIIGTLDAQQVNKVEKLTQISLQVWYHYARLMLESGTRGDGGG